MRFDDESKELSTILGLVIQGNEEMIRWLEKPNPYIQSIIEKSTPYFPPLHVQKTKSPPLPFVEVFRPPKKITLPDTVPPKIALTFKANAEEKLPFDAFLKRGQKEATA